MSAQAHRKPLALRRQDDLSGQFHNELAEVVDRYAPVLELGNVLLVVGYLLRNLERAYDNTRPRGNDVLPKKPGVKHGGHMEKDSLRR